MRWFVEIISLSLVAVLVVLCISEKSIQDMELNNMNDLDIDLDVKSNLISLKEDQTIIGEPSYPAMQTILLTNNDLKQPPVIDQHHQIPPNVVIQNTLTHAPFLTNDTLLTLQGDNVHLPFIQQQHVQIPIITNQLINQPIDFSQTIYNTVHPGLLATTFDEKEEAVVLLQSDEKETVRSLKNYAKKLEKIKKRDIENVKFQEEILSTENLKSLVPHLVDVTSSYLKKTWNKDDDSSSSSSSTLININDSSKDCFCQAEPIIKRDVINDFDDSDIDLRLSTKEDQITTDEKFTVEKEENISKEEIIEFTKMFKQKRVKFGFTQTDVGLSLGNMLGNLFSQTHVCRFEAMQLSHSSMCNLYPLFSKWIDEVESKLNGGESSSNGKQKKQQNIRAKKRRKRTSLDFELKGSLEALFMTNQKPNGSQLGQISKQLNIEKEVVRVWFCNRRQREKKNIEIGMFRDSISLQPKPMFINVEPIDTVTSL